MENGDLTSIPNGVTFPSNTDKLLGTEYVKISKDEVIATLKITDKLTQPMGVLHGGINVVLAETVASVGSYANTDKNVNAILGQEINANHIRPGVVGDTLVAVGKPIFLGRRSHLWEIIISSQNTGKTICVSRCTVSIVPIEEVKSKMSKTKNTSGKSHEKKLVSKL